MRPPVVEAVGTNRIIWKNFSEACTTMDPEINHVFLFFLTELGTTGSITLQNQFLLKGKFKPKYIESLLKKYIQEYVTSGSCQGVDTTLRREEGKMTVMLCETCKATRAVAPIQKGFVPSTRQDRLKEAATRA